ncbi:mRNA cleavage and polyadenylation factor subunit [Coniosporium apollinis]|uniref:mRNA cleavage and polyadenylation factor subunit n=1 Tax=Coniosporium apollinis TaxID=61459 RepID=A0ABQ9P4L6_9PEZI|nr:mRNA cleavage and polyadenylation factor subunit [Coniosporium apollinis]
MQCYTELTPPTAVTHAVNLPFLGPKANNLVVAKSSLLQIFELRSIVTEASSKASGTHTPTSPLLDGEAAGIAFQRTEYTTKLVLVSEYTLAGTVTGLARVKTLNTKSGGEALLVSSKDAKLSLVEWDPDVFGISTISIHYYEGEDLQGSPWAPDTSQCYNFLTVDPSSRCAALKFGARQLAILPFRQPGDDLVGGDYDPDLDGPLDRPVAKDKVSEGDGNQTPYMSSFVLPLTALDPALTHPIHLAFLHEYREPTFGVISGSQAPSTSLLNERKDVLNYTVFTLDLEQRASTTLLSVTGLPYDIYQVISLPLPVGGALLVGGNQFVHVDQAGKTSAVAVNEFAKQCSSFAMSDQTDLALRLEGCTVQQFSSDSGDMLVVLNSGELVVLSFKLDGRSVSGISLYKVAEDHGGSSIRTGASCSAVLGRNKVFVGSEDGESAVLGWTRKAAQLTRKRSHAEMLADDADLSFDEEDLDIDDDDLYAGDAEATKKAISSPTDASAPSNYIFRVHDTLQNLAPLRDITFGQPLPSLKRETSKGGKAPQKPENLELVAATGRGRDGGVSVLRHEITPELIRSSAFAGTHAIWSVHAKKPAPKSLPAQSKNDFEASMSADADYDHFMVASKTSTDGEEVSVVYSITSSGLEEITQGEFEREGTTIDVGTLANGTRIIQVQKGEIRSYDSELGLAQIIPMEDEATGADPKIISVSFADPYILVLRDDSSVIVLQADDSGDIEEIERGDAILATRWLSGSIYKSPVTDNKALVCLLSAEGGLHIFELPELEKPAFVAEGLSFLPPTLTPEYAPRRGATRAALTEILLADLGDQTSKTPHLIVRTSTDDLVIYKPYNYPVRDLPESFTSDLRWLKLPQPHLPKYAEEPALEAEERGRGSTLRPLDNVGGYSTVFQTGTSPCFIIKESSSSPKVLSLRGKSVKALARFHAAECERGFAYVDADNILRVAQLPSGFRFGDIGWATRKINVGQEVHALCFHPPKRMYVLGTSGKAEFKLPEDDYHHEWSQEDINFRPLVDQGMLKLLDPAIWSVVDTHVFEPAEAITCVKSMNLAVSENNDKRKQLIAVGTAFIHGEDLPARGNLYVFDVIDVVPEPGRPETGKKLKIVGKEELKGAVTALSEVGAQGFLLVAQGQKCMVRGLKEDGQILPLAFMDMQCYVTVAKELYGTGMMIFGDAMKGLWFAGYTEEPYKMLFFGKSRSQMEVLAAEFMPYEQQLYIIVADGHCDIHVLQFDPEHPKSLSGQRLLHKSTFHTGHFPTSMTLVPSTLSPLNTLIDNAANPNTVTLNGAQPRAPLRHVLLSTQSGVLALITPLDEQTYRRLGALQTYLTNLLDHPCGLNPRAYRAVESEGFGGRGIVDGGVLRRWCELGSQKRAEAAGKLGTEEWVVGSDLEVVGGGGLGFL